MFDDRRTISRIRRDQVAEHLTKPRQYVVNQLNLAIPAGTVYGFLGRNGAGKSTTIRMLLGMAHPTYGRAALLGHDVSRLPPEVRGRIAYLAEGHPLYGWMTVAEAARFSRRFHAGHWNQPLLDHVLEHFRAAAASEDPAAFAGPAGASRRSAWRSPPIPTCSSWTIRRWVSTRSRGASSSSR